MAVILPVNKHDTERAMRLYLTILSLVFIAQFSFSVEPVRSLGSFYLSISNIMPNQYLYYSMNTISGVSVADDSGNGRTGTTQGSPLTSIGVSSAAVLFDGINDRILFPTYGTGTGIITSFFFEAFVRPDNQALGFISDGVISITNSNTAETHFLGVNDDTKQASASVITGAISIEYSSGPALNDGNYHYIACAKRGNAGGAFELYVDGKLIASTIMTNDYRMVVGDSFIGFKFFSGEEYHGDIDEAGIITGPASVIPSMAEINNRAFRFSGSKKVASKNITASRVLGALR